MTVDITQDEMNILNLNGISQNDIKANVDYMRATGLDDNAIRQHFASTINELRPVTKTSVNDTGKIQEWQNKGGITPYEVAQREYAFNGTYNNVIQENNVNKRAEENKKKIEERNKRVNEGTASFFDRAGAALDRWGEQYLAEPNYSAVANDPVRRMAGIDENGNLDHRDKSKPIGFGESYADSFMSGSWLPFVGGFVGSYDKQKEREIAAKMREGKPIRQDELNFINHRRELNYEKNVRGYTIGGNIAKDFLPSLIKFGGEMATGGFILKSLGLTTELAEGATLGQKVAHGLGDMIKIGAVNALLPHGYSTIYDTYQNKRFDKEIQLTDNGDYIFRESQEKPAISFLKSLGSTFILYASEGAGELIGIPIKGVSAGATKYIGTPITKYVSDNKVLSDLYKKITPQFSKLYEKINNLPIKGESLEWLKSRVKYDGFLEELGEEVLEDILNLTLGTGDEERTLENYAKAIFKSPDEWAVLAGAVALQGATLSVTASVLGSHMEKNGATDEEIIETLSNLSEGEKQAEVEKLIENNEINLNNLQPSEKEEIRKLEDNFYNKLMETGRVSEEKAFEISKLMGVFKENYGSENEENEADFWNWYNKLQFVNYDIDKQEEAESLAKMEQRRYEQASTAGASENEYEDAEKEYEEKGTESKYFKRWFGDSKVVDENGKPLVVYHGSVNTFDTFDSEKASPEGDMGSGFYFTDNEVDVDSNYYGGGPDFDNKVTRLAEQIEQESDELDYDQAKEMAIQELKGEPKKFEVYLSLKNPCYVGSNETLLLSDIFDEVDINEDDYEDYGEYETARNEAEEEILQTISYELDDKLGGLLQYSDIERARGILFDYLYEGGVSLQQLKDKLNEEYFDSYETGDIVSNEVARRIVEALGYDGIIDDSVTQKFSNMGMEEGTTHYIAFYPEQIKAVDNKGTFDSTNPNIYYQKRNINNSIRKAVNIARKIFGLKEKATIQDLLDNVPQLNPIRDFFEGIEDVLIDTVKKGAENQTLNGFYNPKNDTMYINLDSIYIQNMTTQRILTLIHELQHAKQKRTYDKYKKDLAKKNTAGRAYKEKFVKDYENTLIANKEKDKFRAKHKKELAEIFKLKYQLNPIAFEDELYKPENANLREVYSEWKRVYNVYYHSEGEKDARNTAYIYLQKLGLGDKYEDDLRQSNRELYLSRRGYSENVRRGWLSFGRGNRKDDGFSDGSSRDGRSLENRIKYYQAAYHGGASDFDNFDLSYALSGEGAMAHGYGVYTAKNKDVAEGYRERLTKSLGGIHHDLYTIKNDKNQEIMVKYKGQFVRADVDEEGFIYALKDIKEKGKEKTIQDLTEGGYPDYFINDIKDVNENDIEVINVDEVKGQVFKVDIPDDDVLLDENEPYSIQTEKVQNSIKELISNLFGVKDFSDKGLDERINKLREITSDYKTEHHTQKEWNIADAELDLLKSLRYDDNTGRDIYTAIVGYYRNGLNEKNAEKLTSELLNKYGIKGITYNGQQDGRCYVIFDDKAIKILNKYYQESEGLSPEEENLIAGFTPNEILEKLTQMYEYWGVIDEEKNKELFDKELAKIHILEDALETLSGNHEVKDDKLLKDLYLNVYYIMNNFEIPQDYIDMDKKSKRSYKDYVDLIKAKKEKAEEEYYGYYSEHGDINYIALLNNETSPSTILHETGHAFLVGLNELALTNKKAREQLEAVNKMLGATNGEYTQAQHEKFAMSFEAYLYNGKAPNNKLREVFENFRKWLKSVYEHFQDIPRVEISQEVQDLFDKIFSDDEYYEERKKAKELLKEIKTVPKKVLKEREKEDFEIIDESKITLTPEQKAYKEAAYDVLWYALSNSKIDKKPAIKDRRQLYMLFGNNHQATKRNKGITKQTEKLEQFLAELDDPFSAGDGFLPEWREYFTDTITEDSDDSALAMQALDTILEQRYLKNSWEEQVAKEDIELGRAAEDAKREYNKLLSSFKNGDRNIALSAYYDWVNTLPSTIKQDYEDKFTYDTAYIEREEKIDKFDKAKRRIIDVASSLENSYSINKNEQYKQVVMEIMKQLNFLQPSDKAKLTANILDVPSLDFLMAQLDSIMDIAKTMEDVNYRRNLEKDIHSELQQTKNIKKSGRSVGKYDYRTNKIFERLRELDKLSPEQANDMRINASKLADAEDSSLSFQEKLYNKFLTYKANGRTFADTDLMKDIYDDIVNIKLIGKAAKSELDLQEELDESKDIDEAIKIVSKKEQAKWLTLNYHNIFSNLESAINLIFNQKIKDKYAAEILYQSTQATAWAYQQKKSIQDEIAKVYNLPQWLWDKKILEYLSETHKYPELRRKYDKEGNILKVRTIDRTLTKMDIINMYIQSMNEVGEKRLKNQWGEETYETILDEMSLEDVKLAEILMHAVQSYYGMVNKMYIKKYGVDLPRVSNYFPFTPERAGEIDTYNEYVAQSYGFTKARSQSELIPMDFHNPIQTVFNHIDSVAKFVYLSESLDKANKIFRNPDVKRAVIDKYGDDAYKTLEQALLNVSCKKQNKVFNGVDQIVNNISSNWLTSNIIIKPLTGLKQLLSATNYAVGMPKDIWISGFIKAVTNYKETIDYMMKIPYINARYNGGYSTESLKQFVENSKFATFKSLKNFLALNIKLGDIGAIIFGGKPYIDYLRTTGMTEEEAIRQFILSTNRSQQSGETPSLSNFQISMAGNPMLRVLTAYRNAQQQYVRMCGDALVSVANGDMTKQQAAEVLFNYAFYQPFIFALATSGAPLRLLLTGDWDDILKDFAMSIFNLGSDSLALFGDVYKYALGKIIDKSSRNKQGLEIPMFSEMITEINRISKKDVMLSDYLHAIGFFIGKLGAGVDVNNAYNMTAGGVSDVFSGNAIQGSLRMIGMTEKRAKHITGNEKKKRK